MAKMWDDVVKEQEAVTNNPGTLNLAESRTGD